MSPQEVERMLVKARAQLLIIPKNAFFATLAMHLTLVESERPESSQRTGRICTTTLTASWQSTRWIN